MTPWVDDKTLKGPLLKFVNPDVPAAIEAGRPLSIDLGCGETVPAGRFGVDRRALPGVSVVADLNLPLDLFPDRSVEFVSASHAFEHVSKLDGLMDEIHRVLTAQGRLTVVVPHAANPLSWSDPTHVRMFGLYSLGHFCPAEHQLLRRPVPCYRSDHLFRVVGVRLCFRPTSAVMRLFERVVNSSARVQEWYEKNLQRVVWAYEIHWDMIPLGK